jgi:hypothetical protein
MDYVLGKRCITRVLLSCLHPFQMTFSDTASAEHGSCVLVVVRRYLKYSRSLTSSSPILTGYEPFLRFFSVLGVGGRLAFSSAAEYLLSPTISGGEAALPSHHLPA